MLKKISKITSKTTSAPARQREERRRSSLLSGRRRSSIHISTCDPDTDNEMTDEEKEPEQVTKQPRRRSSVTFSDLIVSDVKEVEKHNMSQQDNLFYSFEDIVEFRREARVERRMARRNSTGGLAPTMSAAYGLGTTTTTTTAAVSFGTWYQYLCCSCCRCSSCLQIAQYSSPAGPGSEGQCRIKRLFLPFCPVSLLKFKISKNKMYASTTNINCSPDPRPTHDLRIPTIPYCLFFFLHERKPFHSADARMQELQS